MESVHAIMLPRGFQMWSRVRGVPCSLQPWKHIGDTEGVSLNECSGVVYHSKNSFINISLGKDVPRALGRSQPDLAPDSVIRVSA